MRSCALCDAFGVPHPKDEILFEDDVVAVMLHADSAVRGHAMVVAKRHVENASDLTEREWLQFARVQRLAERALIEETGAARAILLKLGIQTPHLHVHIYPVSADVDRSAVMRIIDAGVREARDEQFAGRVRGRLATLTATPP